MADLDNMQDQQGGDDFPKLKKQPKAAAPSGDEFPLLKKKEDTSKTSAVSQSDSSNVPIKTDTPATPSVSSTPDLRKAIFGKQESAFIKEPSALQVAPLLAAEEKRIGGMLGSDTEKSILHDRIQKFKNNFYDGALTAEDVDIIHGGLEGMTNEQAAAAINEKTKKLKQAGDAPLAQGLSHYVTALKKINDDISGLESYTNQVQSAPGYVAPQNVQGYKERLRQLQEQKAWLQRGFTQIYDYQANKKSKEIIGSLKGDVTDASFGPFQKLSMEEVLSGKRDSPIKYNRIGDDSYRLSEKSQEYIRKHVDDYMNKVQDPIINVGTTGGYNKKESNYPDIAQKVIDYFNTVPVVEQAHKSVKEDFIKKHPEAKGVIEHQEAISKYFSKSRTDEAAAYVNAYQDKQFLNIKNRYWGEGGEMMSNPEYEKILHKYAEHVGNKTMPEDVAKKQIEQEVQNTPVLKKIYTSEMKEVENVRNKARDMWADYLQKGLTEVDPSAVINNDGTVGIKGKGKAESKKIMAEYQDAIEKSTAKVLHDQHVDMKLSAEERAKRLGSFWGTFGESLSDTQGALSKYLFDKTGWGGNSVRAFQSEKDYSLPLSESDEAKKWQWKGVSSLADPNFYLSKVGPQLPLFASIGAVTLATEGAGVPEYIGWLSSAGLMDAQLATSTYNNLVGSGQRDVNGNKITELDAANAASSQFRETLLPDLMFAMVNTGILSRASTIAKPSIGKALLGTVKNAAVGAIPMAWQGYLGYANEKSARGEKVDFWDYAQDGNFSKSLIDGMIGGSIIGLAHLPSTYSKMTENWKRLIYNAEGELKNNALLNSSLQHEMNGNGDQLRDALKIKFATEDWTGRDAEKEKVQQMLKYSVSLDRNIKAAGIDIKDIHGAYQAHNLALADLHDSWAEQAGDNKNLSKIYADQAKDFRERAKNSMEGKNNYYYLQDASDKPIFISDESFKVLDKSGNLKDLMEKGIIKNVIKSDDPEFASKYKQQEDDKVSAKPPVEAKLEEKDTDKIIGALKGNIDNFSEAGRMSYGIHLDNPDLHEAVAKELVSQAVEHPNMVREMIGTDAFELIKPIVEKSKPEIEPTPERVLREPEESQKILSQDLGAKYVGKLVTLDGENIRADRAVKKIKTQHSIIDDIINNCL